MQPLTKAFIPFGEYLWILGLCGLAWAAGRLHARLTCKRGASLESFKTPSRLSLREDKIIAAAAQALNFGFGSVVAASTSFLTCTNDFPGPKSRLVLDAEVECFVWWQKALMWVVGSIFLSLALLALFSFAPASSAPRRFVAWFVKQPLIIPFVRMAVEPFHDSYRYWFIFIVVERVTLAVLHADVSVPSTIRAYFSICASLAFLVLQASCYPFRRVAHNRMQTLLQTCTVLVAALNIVPADLATNAMSTSEKMDNVVTKLISIEAALLFVPVSVVIGWHCVLEFQLPRKLRALEKPDLNQPLLSNGEDGTLGPLSLGSMGYLVDEIGTSAHDSRSSLGLSAVASGHVTVS